MKKVLWLAVIMILPLLAETYTLQLSQDDVEWFKQGEYTQVEIEGYSSKGDAGQPLLPSRNFSYILPRTDKASNINVTSIKTFDIAGENKLIPVGGVDEDPAAYENDGVIPEQSVVLAASGYQNGASMATVSFCPVIYEPAEGRIQIITEVTFEIESKTAEPAGYPQVSWWRDYENFADMLEGSVENPEDVGLYAPQWETVHSVNVNPSMLFSSSPLITSALIIVPQNFFDTGVYGTAATQAFAACTTFVQWQRKTGRPLGWCTYEMIYAGYLSGNTPQDSVEAIRDFLRDAHYSVTSYGYTGVWTVILVGDGTTVAPVARLYPDSTADGIPSDYYFASIEAAPSLENWDVDLDGRLGEADAGEGDAYFDLYVGRVPANHPDHFYNWLEKQLYYESDATIAGQLNLSTVFYCYDLGQVPKPERDDYDEMIPVQSVDNPNGYMTWTVYGNCSGIGAVGHHDMGNGFHCHVGPTDGNASRTSYMITNLDDNQKVNSTGSGDPSALSALNNHDKYSVAYPLNPYSCNFENPASIAAGYLSLNTRVNGSTIEAIGSPICIGATGQADLTSENLKGQTLQKWFYKNIFQVDQSSLLTSPHSVGWGHYKAKEDYWDDRTRQECYSYNLFGAPWTCPWLGDMDGPGFDSLYVDGIPAGDLTEGSFYTLQVKENNASGSPVENAILTVYQPQIWSVADTAWCGGWIESYNTVSGGYANIYLDPDDVLTGEDYPLYITAVRYQETIPRLNWNSQRPEQYLPSNPVQKIVAGLTPPTSTEVEEDSDLPKVLSLEVSKRPVRNGNISIKFGNPSTQHINLSVYDASGRRLTRIDDGLVVPGWYERSLDCSNLAKGTYFVILCSEENKLSKKLVIVD